MLQRPWSDRPKALCVEVADLCTEQLVYRKQAKRVSQEHLLLFSYSKMFLTQSLFLTKF